MLAGFIAATLALAACGLPPLIPALAPGEVDQTFSEALSRAERVARDRCLGRGGGEVRVTIEPTGLVSNAEVLRLEDVADVPCVEAAFRRAKVLSFEGAPVEFVCAFRLDAMMDAPEPTPQREPLPPASSPRFW